MQALMQDVPYRCAGRVAAMLMAAVLSGALAMPSAEAATAAAPAAGASGPQSAPQKEEMVQGNDGSDYIAAWSVMGDMCQDQYPQLKPAVEEFWHKRWTKEIRERVAVMKKTPEFAGKLEKFRKSLGARRDEILEQCGKLFMGGAH